MPDIDARKTITFPHTIIAMAQAMYEGAVALRRPRPSRITLQWAASSL